jgi:hypothetical protein
MTKLLLFPDIDTSPSLTATPSCTCAELIWEEGRVLSPSECDFSNLEFRCETLPSGEMTDFAVTDSGAPIVSERLKAMLREMNVNVQYFPVRIIEKSGSQSKQGYYAINIVGLVDCIDFGASDLVVEEEEGEIVDVVEVGTLVLKNESFGDLYRMYMFERVIVVEGHFAEKLQSLGIKGMKLMRPEKWDGIASEKI